MFTDVFVNKSLAGLRGDCLQAFYNELEYSALKNFSMDSTSRLATYRVLSQLGNFPGVSGLKTYYFYEAKAVVLKFADMYTQGKHRGSGNGFYVPEGVEVTLCYKNGYLDSVKCGFPFAYKDCKPLIESLVPSSIPIVKELKITGYLAANPVFVTDLFKHFGVKSPFGAVASYLATPYEFDYDGSIIPPSVEQFADMFQFFASSVNPLSVGSVDFYEAMLRLESLGFGVVSFFEYDPRIRAQFLMDLEEMQATFTELDLPYFADSFKFNNLAGEDIRLIPYALGSPSCGLIEECTTGFGLQGALSLECVISAIETSEAKVDYSIYDFDDGFDINNPVEVTCNTYMVDSLATLYEMVQDEDICYYYTLLNGKLVASTEEGTIFVFE